MFLRTHGVLTPQEHCSWAKGRKKKIQGPSGWRQWAQAATEDPLQFLDRPLGPPMLGGWGWGPSRLSRAGDAVRGARQAGLAGDCFGFC